MSRGIAFSLVLLFAFAIGCASLVAPSLSLASVVPGCSRSSPAGEEMECSHPSFLCDFESSPDLISKVLPTSTRTHELSKDTLSLAAYLVSDIPLVAENSRRFASVGSTPQKVSVHLFHSVLTL
jgi:hypothetical protein